MLILFSILITGFSERALAQKTITIQSEGLFPEGIVYDYSRRGFWISSARYGKITLVDENGSVRSDITDTALITSTGLKIREDKLYVCVGDIGLAVNSTDGAKMKAARVLVFDLKTKKRLKEYRLEELSPGAHFANDETIDKNGNVYVTDSFSPLIYRITPDGHASIFIRDDRFMGEGVNLNGIAWNKDGYLIAGKQNDGRLFKVDLATKIVTEVKLAKALMGADGLLFGQNGDLYVVTHADSVNRVVRLHSTDHWASAQITAVNRQGFDFPTTAAKRGATIYVLNGRLEHLFSGENHVASFSIVPIR